MTLSASRPARFLAAVSVALGLLAPLAVAAPAAAAADCEPSPPFSPYPGTSMEFVHAASSAIGSPAVIALPELCITSAAVVTELSNDAAVTVDIIADGSFASGATLTPPSPDFEGIARVDLQVVDGPVSFVLELYGLFGVDPTEFGFDFPAPVETAVGAPAFFPLDGIVVRPGGTITVEVIRSTQPVSVTWVEVPSPGVVVTPPAGFRGTIGVEVLLSDGITARAATVFAWAGVAIPTGAIWAPNPPPVAIEKGGTGYFDISGTFVPHGSECEIRVTTVPDVTVVTAPPPLQGVAFEPLGIEVRDDDFEGLLTVSYDLSCRLPDQSLASVQWDLLLYVGVPLPELAATGPREDVRLLGATALALLVLGGVVLGRRPMQRR